MEKMDEKQVKTILSRIKTPDGRDLFLTGTVKIIKIKGDQVILELFTGEWRLTDIDHMKNYILRRLHRYNLKGDIKLRR